MTSFDTETGTFPGRGDDRCLESQMQELVGGKLLNASGSFTWGTFLAAQLLKNRLEVVQVHGSLPAAAFSRVARGPSVA